MEQATGERMTVLEKLYTLKVECQIEGMKAENKQREIAGHSMAYTEEQFLAVADEIQKAMEVIADSYKKERLKAKRKDR